MEEATKPRRRKPFYKARYRKTSPALVIFRCLVTLVAVVLSVAMTLPMLEVVLKGTGVATKSPNATSTNVAIMDRYDTYVSNSIANALEGMVVIKKIYWLSDDDLVAPEPDQKNYGTTTNPKELEPILDRAEKLLGITDTLFTTDVDLYPDSEITYYLDETILVITWKEMIHDCAYTFSEVKIAHPSQFRRFLADGTYGSDKQYVTTEMAATVNAVTASSGDFYKFRGLGVKVYNGTVYQAEDSLDICYITEDGEMIFSRRGENGDMETAQKFVDDNKVLFSLAFGPILVDNGMLQGANSYPIGEINKRYSRAGLGQLGDLHYLLVTANLVPGGGVTTPTMEMFAEQMLNFGCEKAYSLDGGQTAVIVTGDKLINRPDWGYQRQISDIIYFATALPEEE